MRKAKLSTIVIAAALTSYLVINMFDSESFDSLLKYEVQNRAYALASVKVGVDISDQPEQKEFMQAYLALEQLNQDRYSRVLPVFGMEMKASQFTNFRIWGSGLVFPLVQKTAIGLMSDAAERYMPKLKRLEELAPSHDDFFNYVVAQEQAQVDALAFAKAGKFDEGTKVLKNFVESNPIEH